MTKRKSKGAYMLSRLAGVTLSLPKGRARWRNPERSEGTRD
jgi:hypothetical protein